MSDTYVLVTGAWHGGWAWRPVAQHLRAAGRRVITPTLPGLADGDDPTRYTLDDVVAAIASVIEENDLHDVTLVGHSWGGYPITGAAHKVANRLRKVVYWSAFVPSADAALIDEVPPSYRDMFNSLAAASKDNSITLPYQVWQEAFIQDAPEPTQRLIHDLLVPQPLQYFTAKVKPLSDNLDRAYVLGNDDLALPHGEYGWNRFPPRLGVTAINTKGSHEACFTQPEDLAHALLEA